MKKGLQHFAIVVSSLLVSSSLIHAQPFSMGVMAGPNLTIGQFESSSQTGKVGFQVQSSVFYELNDKISIGSGLGFIQKRSADDISLTDKLGTPLGNGKLVYEGNYLELPISLSIKSHKNIQLSAGPRFWYKINGEVKLEDSPLNASVRTLKNFDYGIGLDMLIPVGDFRVSLFYNRGFNDITSNPDVQFSNTMGLNLGYSFFN